IGLLNFRHYFSNTFKSFVHSPPFPSIKTLSAKTLGLLLSNMSFFDHPPVKKFDSFESHLFTKVIIPINLSACKLLSLLFFYTPSQLSPLTKNIYLRTFPRSISNALKKKKQVLPHFSKLKIG